MPVEERKFCLMKEEFAGSGLHLLESTQPGNLFKRTELNFCQNMIYNTIRKDGRYICSAKFSKI